MTPPPPPAARPAAPAPVGAQDRALLPDALRGLALAGIAVINVQDFAGFRMWDQVGLDRAVQVLTDVLANGKAVTLFAMLFGWGAAGLWERHGRALYLRRHLLLFAVGTLHFVLLWHGDIIAGYALSAAVFMLLLRRPTGALLRWAWGLYLLGALGALVGLGAYSAALGSRFLFSGVLDADQSYLDLVAERAAQVPAQWLNDLSLVGFTVPLFAFGAWAYRTGLLSRPAEHRALLRRLAAWGTGLGVPLGLALAYANTLDTLQAGVLTEGLRVLSGLPMALGYVGIFGLLSLRARVPAALPALAGSGRLALTHYLTQSLVFTLIFYPYTFGLYGRVGAGAAVLTALAVALAQIAFSRWYLRRFGRGPLETALRLGVYGRRGLRAGRD